MDEQRMEPWLKSLERISAEIQELWLDRHIWRGTRDIAAKSSVASGSFFVTWLGVQYYRRAAIAVRTMVDKDSRTASFINLMEANWIGLSRGSPLCEVAGGRSRVHPGMDEGGLKARISEPRPG